MLTMTDTTYTLSKSSSLKDPIWGFSWSNPNISDEVLIRKALIGVRFTTILQACLDFGLDHVRKQWGIVAQDSEPMSIRTRSLVNDILGNITEGFSNAKSLD